MQGKKNPKKRTSSPKPSKGTSKKTTTKKTSKTTRKKKTSKKKMGRPSDYKQKVLPLMKRKKNGKTQIEELGEEGWTDEKLALFFDVSRSSIEKWKVKYPEFKKQLDKGKMVADGKVVRSLFERAVGYEHPEEKIFQYEGVIIRAKTVKKYPPDTPAGIWWTKNRLGWMDRPDFNLFDDVEIKVNIVPRNSDSSADADNSA